jgi:hypothetical protein
LVEFYNNQSYKPDQNDFQITMNRNQIQRVKDARIGETKMVMMHVVTGQDYKYLMVKETIGLTNTLYDATQIDLKGETNVKDTNERLEELPEQQVEQSGGSKYYKINYDFVEIID